MREVAGAGNKLMNVFGSGLGLMGAVALGLLGTSSAPALAVPLDAPACEQLQAEFDTLRGEGAVTDMARGPDWARANLPLGGLQRIERYIEVEEQLNFRCGLAKTRITLPTTIEGGEEEISAPGETTPGAMALPQRAPSGQKRPANAAAAVTVVPKTPAQQVPAQKAAPQKASAPKASPAAAPATAKSGEKAAATPKAKPKPAAEGTPPKKKTPSQSQKQPPQVDDAYRPPARPMTSDQNRTPPPVRQ